MAIQKITASVLGNNAVTAANVAAGALSAADIADNSITAAKISVSTSPTFGGLTLGNDSNGANIILKNSDYGNTGLARFFGSDGNEKLQIGANANTQAVMYTFSGVSLDFEIGNNANTLHIKSTGEVGIGKNNPEYILDVVDTTGNSYISINRGTQSQGEVGLKIDGGTSGADWYLYQKTSGNNLHFYQGSDKITLTTDGQIGINKSSGFSTGGFGTPALVIKQLVNSDFGGVNIEANGNDSVLTISTSDTEHKIIGTYRSTAGYKDLDFVLGGTSSVMHMQASNGYIGINRNDPSYYLDIYGESDTHLRLDTISGNAGLFYSVAGSNKWELYHRDNDNSFRLYSYTTSQPEFIVMGATGHVGIGTVTPQNQFEVWNDDDNAFVSVGVRQHSTTTYQGIHFGYAEPGNTNYRKSAIVFERTDLTSSNAQGKVHILNGPQSSASSATLSDAKITIAEDGNVGINGETSPAHSLEVDGKNNYEGVHVRGSNAPCFTLAQGTSSTPAWRMGLSGYAGSDFAISTGASVSDRMRMDTSGRTIFGASNVAPRSGLTDGGVEGVQSYGPIVSGYYQGTYSGGPNIITNWYVYAGPTTNSNNYVHFKTDLYAGSGNNYDYTMSLFYFQSYQYGGGCQAGHLGFHNWSGTLYNMDTNNYGSQNLVQSAYVSSDGYVVLVCYMTASYAHIAIDWHQWGGYGFRDAKVTNVGQGSSGTGVF